MTAKLITVEGSKIKIELTLELSRSMLDTEINIQKSLNEVGCIASKEALKYLDTDGCPLKIGEEIWKTKGDPKNIKPPMEKLQLIIMCINVQWEEKPIVLQKEKQE